MILAALASLVVSLLQSTPPPPGSPQPEAAAWVKANAIAFTTPLAGSGFDDLAGLGGIVGDARVVSLGEPTHGTREAIQMTTRLLEYLVENKGFSIFASESSMPEAYRLNEYVVDGKGDPRKIIAGMSAWPYDTEEFLAMVEWMRAWNEKNPAAAAGASGAGTGKPRLQFVGFDVEPVDSAGTIVEGALRLAAPDLLDKFRSLRKELSIITRVRGWGGPPLGRATATSSLPVSAAKGTKLRFSCWIRTENVSGKALASVICDTPDGSAGPRGMTGRELKGTTEWARHEFTVDVPADTPLITFGFILEGDGAAWFDDVEFELDGVPYDDPDLFSLDFENDDVDFLRPVSREYTMKRAETRPHGGRKSLELRRRPEREVPRTDPQGAWTRARAALSDLEARRDALATKLGPKKAERAIQHARLLVQCAAMYARDDSFNARDEGMAQNVQWILDQHPGQKAVLWAHNGHVTKGRISGLRTMGQNLHAALGDQMIVFGFATGSGEYAAFARGGGGLKSDAKLALPGDAGVEAVFGEAGLARAILDIRKASADDPATRWLTQPAAMRAIGSVTQVAERQFSPWTLSESFDVIVWQGTTTAVRKLE